MCFIHRTHYSARHLSGTFQKCWLLWLAKVGWRRRGVGGGGWVGGIGYWGRRGVMGYPGGDCQNGVTLWFPCRRPCDLTLIHIWTWSVSRICFAAAAVDSRMSGTRAWLTLERSHSISGRAVETEFIVIIIASVLTVWWSLIELALTLSPPCLRHSQWSECFN